MIGEIVELVVVVTIPAVMGVVAEVRLTAALASGRAGHDVLRAFLADASTPALLDALVDADRSVRETAVALLGNVGASAPHVVELRRVAEMYAHDAAFVRASRAAVAAIQSRLVGAERGQLAVAADAGELSLADAGVGRVSLGVQAAPGSEG